MELPSQPKTTNRYGLVSEEKSSGATYTPMALAEFVATQIVNVADLAGGHAPIRILDPAVGEGELLASLVKRLPKNRQVAIFGFDTNEPALRHTECRLRDAHPHASVHLTLGDFLAFVLERCGGGMPGGLFEPVVSEKYDLIIANPPYVRTQILGAQHARTLANEFGLTGRVDLYHAFLLGMSRVLKQNGIAGIIVSNRFMTTKAGASVRRGIRDRFDLLHVWDLGDTKLFDAAVLPAVLLARGANGSRQKRIGFTSIYETQAAIDHKAKSAIEALAESGVIEVADGRRFEVRQGRLNDSDDSAGVWCIETDESEAWLATVDAHTWRTFGDIGNIRVGVKTCADKVFIRSDWDEMDECPELLRALTTHHIARRFRAKRPEKMRQIVYPHESSAGKRRVVDLDRYPLSKAYLQKHRETLERRKYVLEAGRHWYEIWVPQDPAAWARTKLVFRDITDRPCFWIDREGSVVNGDCYWMVCDRQRDEELLWIAVAIGNSTFVESYYDCRFNNKLYSGRRRFITQYVEQFPLPNPKTTIGKAIIEMAKLIYDAADTSEASPMNVELDIMVWKAFGLSVEEVGR